MMKEGGVEVLCKDIKKATLHEVTVVEHELAGGTLPPDYFNHRELVKVEMNDGSSFEILRETVDADGNFSTVSAKMVTKEVGKA